MIKKTLIGGLVSLGFSSLLVPAASAETIVTMPETGGSIISVDEDNRIEILIVDKDGDEEFFIETEERSLSSFLRKHNLEKSDYISHDVDLDKQIILQLGDSLTLYERSMKGNTEEIKLVLPDVVEETDELFVGEEEEEKGRVGKALKTTVITEKPQDDGSVVKIKEESMTVLVAPKAKVIKKGVKERPQEVVETSSEVEVSRSSPAMRENHNTPPPASRMESVVATAEQFLGVPYVFAGSSPSGFDCSGLTSYVYGLHGINLPRTSYAQAGAGVGISYSDAQPGDLLILNGGGHVGIYVGNGQMIHAPRPGKFVEYSPLAYYNISGVRRL